MIVYRKKSKKKQGRGLVNKLINKLPFELHLPGYQYCGPGTKLAKRLVRGDSGINPLDSACKDHDIAYSKNRDNLEARHIADRVLADKAWERVHSSDAGIGEKAAAWAVTNAMKMKTKFGMGLKQKRKSSKKKKKRAVKKKKRATTSLNTIIKAAVKSRTTSNCAKKVISSAIKGARAAIKKIGDNNRVKIQKMLPISAKIEGFLPYLIPLFTGLSATGALAGGVSGVAKTINQAKAAKRQLKESQRHNKTMEAIALGKGLHLKPYKRGFGLYLKPFSGSGLKKKDRCNFTFTQKSIIQL